LLGLECPKQAFAKIVARLLKMVFNGIKTSHDHRCGFLSFCFWLHDVGKGRKQEHAGSFSDRDCVAETVTEIAMRLFQRLAIDINQLDINYASVTARSIVNMSGQLIILG